MKPAAPPAVSLITESTVTTSWPAAPSENGTVTFYYLYWVYTDRFTTKYVKEMKELPANAKTQYTITGLPDATTLVIHYRVRNAAGMGPPSATVEVKTKHKGIRALGSPRNTSEIS